MLLLYFDQDGSQAMRAAADVATRRHTDAARVETVKEWPLDESMTPPTPGISSRRLLSAGGSSTASTPWTTPFSASMSGAVTVASPTLTTPSITLTVSTFPDSVVSSCPSTKSEERYCGGEIGSSKEQGFQRCDDTVH